MKKLACLFAVAALLAGCGNNSDGGDDKDTNTPTSTVTGEGTATNESNGETLTTTAKVTMDGDKFTSPAQPQLPSSVLPAAAGNSPPQHRFLFRGPLP